MIYEPMEGQMSLFGPDSWSGKMSPERSVPTKEKTLGSSSKKRQGSKTRMPLFLDLRTENGVPADASWAMGIPSVGGYSTYSIGESPTSVMMECRLNSEHRRGVGESRLSQILTPSGVQQKYYLSEAACQGILRRAENRGKELPTILKKALENQASVSKNELDEKVGQTYVHEESANTLAARDYKQPQAINTNG